MPSDRRRCCERGRRAQRNRRSAALGGVLGAGALLSRRRRRAGCRMLTTPRLLHTSHALDGSPRTRQILRGGDSRSLLATRGDDGGAGGEGGAADAQNPPSHAPPRGRVVTVRCSRATRGRRFLCDRAHWSCCPLPGRRCAGTLPSSGGVDSPTSTLHPDTSGGPRFSVVRPWRPAPRRHPSPGPQKMLLDSSHRGNPPPSALVGVRGNCGTECVESATKGVEGEISKARVWC